MHTQSAGVTVKKTHNAITNRTLKIQQITICVTIEIDCSYWIWGVLELDCPTVPSWPTLTVLCFRLALVSPFYFPHFNTLSVLSLTFHDFWGLNAWAWYDLPLISTPLVSDSTDVLPKGVIGPSITYLLSVFPHIGVDLAERAHGVELIHVHPRLLCQVGIHVLVTDRWHLVNV